MDATQHIAQARARMEREGVDALLIMRATNVDYITGFDGIHDEEEPHVALLTSQSAQFFTDTRYVEVASKQAAENGYEVVCIKALLIDEVVEALAALGATRVALEGEIAYSKFKQYQEKLEGVEVIMADRWIEKIRLVKNEEELERIAAAQAVTDKAFEHICSFIKEGMTEREIAVELEYAMVRFGAEGLAFSTIIASGPNGSLPHAVPGDRAVQRGDFITLDFGAQVAGYKSDMTRTVCVGEPSDEARVVYETVLAAHLAAHKAVKAGASGVEVDAAARAVIDEAGFGEYFGHGLGHGVGRDIHEGPTASPRSKDTLEAGHTLTIEPGIYLPEKLGVRIEDLVVVTDDGERVFTASPRELIIVG